MDKERLTTDKLGLLIPDDELERFLEEDAKEKKEPGFKAYYKDDKPFRRNARLWQSRWRKRLLKDKGENRRGTRNGNEWGSLLLDDDAKKGLNFYPKDFSIFEWIQNDRLEKKKKKYNKNIDPDLLRSEHIPFNMFIPLYEGKDKPNKYFTKIFNEIIGNKIESIYFLDIEKAPKPIDKYLDDKTSFDVYIEYICKGNKGEKGIIGIETKYTESGDKVYEKERYLDVTKNQKKNEVRIYNDCYNDCFLEKEEYKKTEYNQRWRNHILGESILQSLLPDDKKFTEFTSITIYPKGNDYYDGVSQKYPNFLKDDYKYKCLFLIYEDLFDLFEKHCKEMEQPKKGQYEDWIKWMRERYIVNFKDDPL